MKIPKPETLNPEWGEGGGPEHGHKAIAVAVGATDVGATGPDVGDRHALRFRGLEFRAYVCRSFFLTGCLFHNLRRSGLRLRCFEGSKFGHTQRRAWAASWRRISVISGTQGL